MPAKAGIQNISVKDIWIPTYAGMTGGYGKSSPIFEMVMIFSYISSLLWLYKIFINRQDPTIKLKKV